CRSMTGNCKALAALADEPGYVSMSPADADARGIEEEQLVWVRSRRGKVLARAAVDERVNEGAVYMTYQWWIGKCNELTLHAVDGESGTPEDKYSACEVEAIADQRWAEDHLVERYAALKAELAAEADRQNPPEPEPKAAAEPAAAASEPSKEAPTPAAAFAPHEAEVAGRALYANGEEETLV
ncbi:MAG TPA: formate dehydrogenase subunit alpha, partial [Gordonibacter urolithinfaciens]|uniref:molybdopterin dinucleotide binding domain-containing protein n=1 Tax=Gordonibacter urolithinfaciens TaxID=1335613 RepID=UPI001D7D6079